MRRILIAIGSTLTGLALLFSWPTSTNRSVTAEADTTSDTTTGTTSDGTTSDGTTDGSVGTTTPEATAEATAEPEATTGVTGTFVGAAASTRYGDVQVQITVTDGVITAADAIAYPNRDRESQQINSWAVPALNDSTLAAQSASIEMMSHATITSNAYAQSLQDALDQAGL